MFFTASRWSFDPNHCFFLHTGDTIDCANLFICVLGIYSVFSTSCLLFVVFFPYGQSLFSFQIYCLLEGRAYINLASFTVICCDLLILANVRQYTCFSVSEKVFCQFSSGAWRVIFYPGHLSLLKENYFSLSPGSWQRP